MDFSVSLKSNKIFRRLYSRGRSAVSPYMVLYCRQNGSAGNRLGITVSTKLGGAVRRNRIRRRIRETYRLNEYRLAKGWDIVIVARSAAVKGDFKEIEAEFIRLSEKLGILNEKGIDCTD